MKNNKGITIIALVITIIVLIIVAGVSISSLTKEDKGMVDQAREKSGQAQRESILQKIEADIYNEKIKKGRNLSKAEAEQIINQYGTIEDSILTTIEGSYQIQLEEITGWKQAK